jgi:hypothetical protein
MYWHVLHGDHVASGSRYICLADDEAHARKIVDAHNAEIDGMAGEIRRLRAGYAGGTGMMDAARLQLLDHLEGFLKRERSGTADLQIAVDCLTSYLLDTTERVFEEDLEIDNARTAIQGRLDQEQKEKA